MGSRYFLTGGAIFSEAGILRGEGGASFKKRLQKDHNPQKHQKSMYGRRWLEYKDLSSCKAMVMYYHQRFFLKGVADKMKKKSYRIRCKSFFAYNVVHKTV